MGSKSPAVYIGSKVLFLKDYQRLEDGMKFTFQLKWVMWYWGGRVKQKIRSEQASSKVSIIFNVRCYAIYVKLYIWVCMYISLYIYKSIIYLPICIYLPISIFIYRELSVSLSRAVKEWPPKLWWLSYMRVGEIPGDFYFILCMVFFCLNVYNNQISFI